MHYRNGQEAKLGDHVRGTGYNVKGADGQPAVISGVVIGLTPGTDTCNIRVAHATPPHDSMLPGLPVTLGVEYGQCDHFDPL